MRRAPRSVHITHIPELVCGGEGEPGVQRSESGVCVSVGGVVVIRAYVFIL